MLRRLLVIALLVLTSCVPVSVDDDVRAGPDTAPVGNTAPDDNAAPVDNTASVDNTGRGAAGITMDGGVDATVSRVADGDSVEVRYQRASDGLALGAEGDGSEDKLRLTGINANELSECFGTEAGNWLRDRLAGQAVRVVPGDVDGPGERDPFGRLLAYVVIEGSVVNAELVEEGFAVARAQSEHPLADDFEQLETQAIESARGLWARDACETAAGADPTATITIVELRADAAGRDDQNPNDEWIVITNGGATDVDLSGWTVKDESTSHRYVFDDTTLAPGDRLRLRSGCESDDGADDTLDANTVDRFWCDRDPIWNNSGDTAFVLDPAGNIVASQRHVDDG